MKPFIQQDLGFPTVRYRFFRVSLVFWIVCTVLSLMTAPLDGSARSVAMIVLGFALLGAGVIGWVGEQRSYLVLQRSAVPLLILTTATVAVYVLDERVFSAFQQATIALVLAAAAGRGIPLAMAIAVCCSGLPELAQYLFNVDPSRVFADERNWMIFGWLPVTVLAAWTAGAILASYDRASDSAIPGEFGHPHHRPGESDATEARELQVEVDLGDLLTKVAEAPLTDRQRAVIALLMQGQTNAQIASALDISPRTVQAHVRSALEATGAVNRTRLGGGSVSIE